MKYFFILLISFPVLIFSEWDHFFPEDEDLTLFHQVNVITGNLNFVAQDAVIQAAVPLSVYRTYSSTGALETRDDYDLSLKELRKGLFIQGGWSFFPHANLLLEIPGGRWKMSRIYLSEPSGSLHSYERINANDEACYFRTTKKLPGPTSGSLSGRQDISNQLIIVAKDQMVATVILPNGGKRIYHLLKKSQQDSAKKFLCLMEEILPSQHRIVYDYDDRHQLKRVALLNPAKDKVLSQFFVDVCQKKTPYHFKIRTSDHQEIDLQAFKHSHRSYLTHVTHSRGPDHSYSYTHGRKGIGARVQSCQVAGQVKYFYHYYGPPNRKKEKSWAKHPTHKDFSCDKVKKIEAPWGPQGAMVTIAQLSYAPTHTDVRDCNNLLVRYHHQDEKLTRVDYFGTQDQLHSSILLLWEGHRLCSKVRLNEQGVPLFSKTFVYDDHGNVIEETFWGNLTGRSPTSFTLNPNGSLRNAESYVKRYRYLPELNVVEFEEEENGLSYHYTYLSGTDLVIAKTTSFNSAIIQRQFFQYDTDHLCIAEITDDGNRSSSSDLTGVTYQAIKTYERDPSNGQVKSVTQSYWDPSKGHLLKDCSTCLTYTPHNQIEREDIYDSRDAYHYSLLYKYDRFGNVIQKIKPLGDTEFYQYDNFGRVTYAKEVGKLEKWMTYHPAGYLTTCREVDRTGGELITQYQYDLKGRLLSQTDPYGNTISQVYDSFGHCLETHFPKAIDETGECYTPVVRFSYDVLGNLISTQAPRGEITATFYNSHQKPVKHVQADGGAIIYYTTKTGQVEETLYPDNTRVLYTYDPFQRMTSKQLFDPDGTLLSHEAWDYSTFFLRSETDSRGLRTEYTYDPCGRKVLETAEDRITEYQYDALGFLERTKKGSQTFVEMHDVLGRVTSTWTENDKQQENVMAFEYDEHYQKCRACRQTSKGRAIDLFAYDAKGRLAQHTDPLGAVTSFIYNDKFINELGQTVLQKITIDPLEHREVETYDAAHRLVSQEKQDSQRHTVFKEQFYYDRSGNLALRLSHVYAGTRLVKTIPTRYVSDAMGNRIEQTESGQKTTLFTYDQRNRCISKILPSGVTLTYIYDGLNRVTEFISSDRTIHHQFIYEKGPEPIAIMDVAQKQSIDRIYNLFGELISEKTSAGLAYQWAYDHEGRRISFTLPDGSSIAYAYTAHHLSSIERYNTDGYLSYDHQYLSYDPNGYVQSEQLAFSSTIQQTERDILERPFSKVTSAVSQSLSYGPSGLVNQASNNLFGSISYAYDALDQLTQEGDTSYQFDSFGSPLGSKVNDHHQIESTADTTLSYDLDGNPIERKTAQQTTQYRYDALGRLTEIEIPQVKKVVFTYDPLSRLVSKTVISRSQETVYYLYDHEFEIGTISSNGTIQELKVQGISLQGDIGGAVAIELRDTVYVPVHDFQGNIIALLYPNGTVAETYHLSAFGRLLSHSSDQNPWVFASKRSEEGLIFFGLRFYDPSLGRWLTPDPAGSIDSPNLYLYVLNNPLRRLDLFGLAEQDIQSLLPKPIDVYVHLSALQAAIPFNNRILLEGKCMTSDIILDAFISCSYFHQLSFSAEELSSGSVGLMHHLHQITPKEGCMIGSLLLINGINCPKGEFLDNFLSVTDKIPEGTLCIGIYNPTEGLKSDIKRAQTMINTRQDTPRIIGVRQMLSTLLTTTHKINPELLTVLLPHSEGGGITTCAIEGMTPDEQALVQQHVYLYNLAPAIPLPDKFAFHVSNIYCKRDIVTGFEGRFYQKQEGYNIQFIPSALKWYDLRAPINTHSFMGKTLQDSVNKTFKRLRQDYGFYDGKNR